MDYFRREWLLPNRKLPARWRFHDIVTKGYGGTLTARSEGGAFTEFIVTLPQDQSVPVAASELAAAEGE